MRSPPELPLHRRTRIRGSSINRFATRSRCRHYCFITEQDQRITWNPLYVLHQGVMPWRHEQGMATVRRGRQIFQGQTEFLQDQLSVASRAMVPGSTSLYPQTPAVPPRGPESERRCNSLSGSSTSVYPQPRSRMDCMTISVRSQVRNMFDISLSVFSRWHQAPTAMYFCAGGFFVEVGSHSGYQLRYTEPSLYGTTSP